jgi:hypothetical protein
MGPVPIDRTSKNHVRDTCGDHEQGLMSEGLPRVSIAHLISFHYEHCAFISLTTKVYPVTV